MNRELFLIECTLSTNSYIKFHVGQSLEKSGLKVTRIVYDHNTFIVTKNTVYKVFAEIDGVEFCWQELENCHNIRKIYPYPNLKANEMLLDMVDQFNQESQ